MLRSKSRMLVSLVVALAVAQASVALGADRDHFRTAEGLAVYLGLVPAELVRGSPPRHAQERMHGGVPRRAGVYHVMVAVFDEATGERLEDLSIEAELASLGRAGARKPLQPMAIADTVTYGEYFTFRVHSRHRIRLWIERPEDPEPVVVEFPYDHPLR